VYQKHGAYYFVKHNRWTNLGQSLPAALAEYARQTTASGCLSEFVDEFLNDSRRTVKPNTLKQYKQAARTIQLAFIEFWYVRNISGNSCSTTGPHLTWQTACAQC